MTLQFSLFDRKVVGIPVIPTIFPVFLSYSFSLLFRLQTTWRLWTVRWPCVATLWRGSVAASSASTTTSPRPSSSPPRPLHPSDSTPYTQGRQWTKEKGPSVINRFIFSLGEERLAKTLVRCSECHDTSTPHFPLHNTPPTPHGITV